jgi:hypothetical protein
MKCLIKYQDKEIRMEGIGRFIAKKVIFFNSKRLAKARTVPALETLPSAYRTCILYGTGIPVHVSTMFLFSFFPEPRGS